VIFTKTRIPDCFVIEAEPYRDDRGFFTRTYCPDDFAAAGIEFKPAQNNLSRNDKPFTLRGLHFQDPPFAEAKLVQVARGAIFDVAVDLRPDSPSFRQWVGVELTADKVNQFYIPEGCAHGFMTLVPGTDVLYAMGRKYRPGYGRGYRYDDPAFAVAWPHAPVSISEADQAWAAFTG
jgi:dTDP-4-dehydrorhamnose 3,5-epimerase